MIHTILQRKLKIEQRDPPKNWEVNPGAPEKGRDKQFLLRWWHPSYPVISHDRGKEDGKSRSLTCYNSFMKRS